MGTSVIHLGSDTHGILPVGVLLIPGKDRGIVILCTARHVWWLLWLFIDVAHRLLCNNWRLHSPIILDECLCSQYMHDISSLCLRSGTWICLNQSWSVWIMFPLWISLVIFLSSGSQRLTLTANSRVAHARSPSKQIQSICLLNVCSCQNVQHCVQKKTK